LCKTDPAAQPRHRGISILLVEHGDGLVVSRDLPKLGYKGVESCELSFAGYQAPAGAVLGANPGHGFAQMMKGLEIRPDPGRLAASGWRRRPSTTRAVRQQRRTFGVADLKHHGRSAIPGRHGDQAHRGQAASAVRRHAVRRKASV